MNFTVRLLGCVLAFGPVALGIAAVSKTPEGAVDKSHYTLLNPTPPELLRELLVDGPGATLSPYTVDAGHFQIEMSFVDFTSEKDVFDGVHYGLDWLAVAPMTLKVGLLNSLDLQLSLEPYNRVYEREVYREPGYVEEISRTTRHGFGDTSLRLKYNFWGNDHGRTALGLAPFVKFPTSVDDLGSDIVEGGVGIPFAAQLPWGFHFGLTTRFSSAQDILEGKGRHLEYENSASLAHEVLPEVEAYVEYYSRVSTEKDVGRVGRFDLGLVWWLTDDFQLNAGVNFGLTKWADNANLFTGFAWRY